MSNTDRSAGRRTASLHCRPAVPRVIYRQNGQGMSTWSANPAIEDVIVGCQNRIVDVSGITFCDQSYIGYGASLDISSNDHIVMSVRGLGGYALVQNAPTIEMLTTSDDAYVNMQISGIGPEVFRLEAAPSNVSPAAVIAMNTTAETITLRYGTNASVEVDGSAGCVSLTRSEIPMAIADRVASTTPSYRADYFYEVSASSPPLDVSSNVIVQDGQRLVIINIDDSTSVSVAGIFCAWDLNVSQAKQYRNVSIDPYGSITLRGSLNKKRWVVEKMWGATLADPI